MKPDGLLIFKTLQVRPTNWSRPKGLLTYRTIQFSMSSGCFHPKNLIAFLRDHSLSHPDSFVISPSGGQKILRADFLLHNSATQTFVNFAVSLFQTAPTVNSALHFFVPDRCCCQQREHFIKLPTAVNSFFIFFQNIFSPPPVIQTFKEQGRDNSPILNHRKSFFQKFYVFVTS